ncbi:hypothetical protein LZ32DRAFT_207788 [Colletotrichum eremochloae]|nr:hypothetical protein LZ32DRAFT_207788 [Colletotrichum eremochloae]
MRNERTQSPRWNAAVRLALNGARVVNVASTIPDSTEAETLASTLRSARTLSNEPNCSTSSAREYCHDKLCWYPGVRKPPTVDTGSVKTSPFSSLPDSLRFKRVPPEKQRECNKKGRRHLFRYANEKRGPIPWSPALEGRRRGSRFHVVANHHAI